MCQLYRGAGVMFGDGCDLKGDHLIDGLCTSSLVLILSNLCSNVPTVMLLASKVDDQSGGDDDLSPARLNVAWCLLAWASTVAGNFTLTASIANLIVAERAANMECEGGRKDGLTFWVHFRYASWTTLPILMLGSSIIYWSIMPSPLGLAESV